MTSKVRLSTFCLLIVGMGDLVSSLVWLHAGQGEGNPLFAWLAAQGYLAFALGKVAFVMKHRQAAIALMLSVSVRHSPVKFQVVHVMFSIRATAKAVQTQLVLAVRQPAQR